MVEKCERCEQLVLLAQAYQDALKNTFRVLMVAIQPDTSDARRAEILKNIEEDTPDGSPNVPVDSGGPSGPGENSQEPQNSSDATAG